MLLGRGCLGEFPALVLDDDGALLVRQQLRWSLVDLPTVMVSLVADRHVCTLAGKLLVGLQFVFDFYLVHVGLWLVGRVAEETDVRLGLRQDTVRWTHDWRLLVVTRHCEGGL